MYMGLFSLTAIFWCGSMSLHHSPRVELGRGLRFLAVTLRGFPELFPSLFLGSSGQFLPTLPFDNKAGLAQDARALPHLSLGSLLSCLTLSRP